MTKKQIIWIFTLLCIIALVFPFILFTKDSFRDNLLMSFTALASTATVLTMIVALMLYNKWSIDSFIIERQTDKVLELVDLLKGKMVAIKTEKFTYYSRYTGDDDFLFKEKFYDHLGGRTVIMRREDMDDIFDPINKACSSYWMPEEIKDAAKFFELLVMFEAELEVQEDYAQMMMNTKIKKEEQWYSIITRTATSNYIVSPPEVINDEYVIVNDFISHKNHLIRTVKKWLSDKSSIQIDLRMSETDLNKLEKSKEG